MKTSKDIMGQHQAAVKRNKWSNNQTIWMGICNKIINKVNLTMKSHKV